VKIAITSQGDNLDALVDPRFGRCAYFVIIDPETEEFEAVSNSSADAMGGAGPAAAQTIAEKGAEVLITGNVGPNASQTLKAAGIKVFQVSSGTVREAFQRYKEGKLPELSDSSVAGHFGLRQGGKS
jgi:predicted Fe-Mo cluster-binding NifX family protein